MKMIKRIFTALMNLAGFMDTARDRAESIVGEIKESIEALRTNVGKVAETIRSFRQDTVPELLQLIKDLRELVGNAHGVLGVVSAQQRDLVIQVAKVRTDVAQLGNDVGAELASLRQRTSGDGASAV